MWRPPAPGSHASHGPFGELSPLLLTQCQVGADNTRDPSTGRNYFYGEFLVNAQGGPRDESDFNLCQKFLEGIKSM